MIVIALSMRNSNAPATTYSSFEKGVSEHKYRVYRLGKLERF